MQGHCKRILLIFPNFLTLRPVPFAAARGGNGRASGPPSVSGLFRGDGAGGPSPRARSGPASRADPECFAEWDALLLPFTTGDAAARMAPGLACRSQVPLAPPTSGPGLPETASHDRAPCTSLPSSGAP